MCYSYIQYSTYPKAPLVMKAPPVSMKTVSIKVRANSNLLNKVMVLDIILIVRHVSALPTSPKAPIAQTMIPEEKNRTFVKSLFWSME